MNICNLYQKKPMGQIYMRNSSITVAFKTHIRINLRLLWKHSNSWGGFGCLRIVKTVLVHREVILWGLVCCITMQDNSYFVKHLWGHKFVDKGNHKIQEHLSLMNNDDAKKAYTIM